MSSYDLLVKAQAEDDAWRKEMLELLDEIRTTLKTMNRRMRRETRERKQREKEAPTKLQKYIESLLRNPTQPINMPH